MFPNEIFWEIAQIADPGVLRSFSRVSKDLQQIAERFIYRDLVLRTPSNIVRCFKTLLSRSHLALHARSCIINSPEDQANYLRGFYKLIGCALHAMHNLIRLELLLVGPVASFLVGCSLRLRYFACECDWDAALSLFLEQQDQIRDFLYLGILHAGQPVIELDEKALPHLSRLAAPPPVVVALTPRRPIEEIKLSLEASSLLNGKFLALIARIVVLSRRPIRSFTIIGPVYNLAVEDIVGALNELVMRLPDLEKLGLHLSRGRILRVS